MRECFTQANVCIGALSPRVPSEGGDAPICHPRPCEAMSNNEGAPASAGGRAQVRPDPVSGGAAPCGVESRARVPEEGREAQRALEVPARRSSVDRAAAPFPRLGSRVNRERGTDHRRGTCGGERGFLPDLLRPRRRRHRRVWRRWCRSRRRRWRVRRGWQLPGGGRRGRRLGESVRSSR